MGQPPQDAADGGPGLVNNPGGDQTGTITQPVPNVRPIVIYQRGNPQGSLKDQTRAAKNVSTARQATVNKLIKNAKAIRSGKQLALRGLDDAIVVD